MSPDLQARMVDPDVAGNQEVAHTPDPRRGLKEDQCLILEGLEDQV